MCHSCHAYHAYLISVFTVCTLQVYNKLLPQTDSHRPVHMNSHIMYLHHFDIIYCDYRQLKFQNNTSFCSKYDTPACNNYWPNTNTYKHQYVQTPIVYQVSHSKMEFGNVPCVKKNIVLFLKTHSGLGKPNQHVNRVAPFRDNCNYWQVVTIDNCTYVSHTLALLRAGRGLCCIS